ncbi:putative baseplate assembly protein [Streptomyces albireticuli]|uniref:putative baseplate assembly protein n=1 Tax=Streptomyces albireticuli TaxID=1940 RepID=UPI001E4C9ED4|nr:putative baseplate assembly protein [Streptomyces albireticuli]MCD9145038.1 putative baseplate assembly protein [Streptomyces albireticuli]MCD9164464.1 putative baseplate assembly protein [Streptomyces albireticuli]MCD9194175.1 putative baseplate assembly protein [Streptomyces albireticuli]
MTGGTTARNCATERRRDDVRAADLNGLDGIEVSDDGRTLTVTFLGKAPSPCHIGPRNIRVDGGRRVTGIRAVAVTVEVEADPELDDRMLVTLDKPGDTSHYTLAVVEADAYGRPGDQPYRGFDPRYHRAGFAFGPSCPTPFDCRDQESCPPEPGPRPVIDYTARDYDSLRRLALDRMTLTTPDWAERHVPDLGVTLVELLAHTADQISYQQDAVATEAYLDTARRRVSVRRHVRLVDYPMHDGCNARAYVALETGTALTLEAGTFRFAAVDVSALEPQERPGLGTVIPDEELDAIAETALVEVFEPLDRCDLDLRPAHNAVRLWTWGDEDCYLPKGATGATLRDAWACEDGTTDGTEGGGEGEGGGEEERERVLALCPGDILLIEEVLGPRTGAPADADPAHRQAVRLTSVTPLVDELYDQPVVEVTWAAADALTFPVCLSSRAGTDCAPLTDVSLARANVVLVDHGRSLTHCCGEPEYVTVPPAPVTVPGCEPPGFGCGDRAETTGSAAAVHDLLDRAREGYQLEPGQVRELHRLVGEPAVARAGLDVHLVPGTDGEERVVPPGADAQAAALETLLAQTSYPGLPARFRPVLSYAPVTQAAPYPAPARVAASQAGLLATVPERLRVRLEELWAQAHDGEDLTPDQVAELTVVFGARTLERFHLTERPAEALRELIARRHRLLAGKLRRLSVLVARARAGGVLDARVTWELLHSWGEEYADGLDPADPRLAGPAAETGQDPRTALPAVVVTGEPAETPEGEPGDEPEGEAPTWLPRRDLLSSGRGDRHFVGEPEDDGRLALRFGDGRHGAAPPPGSTLEISYRIGNGPTGNVGAEAINHLLLCRAGSPDVTRVRNPLAAAGGTAPESLDEVRRLAPLALRRTRLRAVTAGDYAELAARVPGVQRAAADLRWTGTTQEVHVAVDPLGTAAPGATLLEAVGHALDTYRRIGHDVVVHPARLIPLDITLTVCAAPGFQRGHVLAELRRVLGTGTLPDGRPGFFHPDALTFGEPVRVSRLVAAAAAVPGVVSVHTTRLRRLHHHDDGELEAGLLRLGPLEIAQCDNDPDWPENGRLGIEIGGGR